MNSYLLTVSKEEAFQRIQKQIDEGNKIVKSPQWKWEETNNTEYPVGHNTIINWNEVYQSSIVWMDYNYHLLISIFINDIAAKEFIARRSNSQLGKSSFDRVIRNEITNLVSLQQRLELMEEPNRSSSSKILTGTSIFIVHGHDDAARHSVARFIEKLGLKPLILQEQPNSGQTIIEKFESHAASIGYALVLLTPDDFVSSSGSSTENAPRARQNVIFELGYFIGTLGRGKVCLLHKGTLEIPSDLQGILYVPIDSNDGWKLSLAREIKQSGIDVDLNKAL